MSSAPDSGYMHFSDVGPSLWGQLIPTSEIRGRNVSSAQLNAAVRNGSLVRIHRGFYVAGPSWKVLTPEARYLLKIQAVARANPRELTFCHESAAALHELPLVTPWPETVHIATPEALGGSSQVSITAHTRANAGESVRVEGLAVTSLARTVIDVAAKGPFVNAISVVDAALRRCGDSFRVTLAAEFERAALKRGVGRASRAIGLGDSRAESVGESLSRARIHELGFAAPELQVRFETPGHRYAVDFYWPEANVIGEFDGRAKYSRAEFTAGSPAEEVVWREKQREDALRAATGARVVRWTWATAMDARELGQLLASAGVPAARGPNSH